MYLAYDPGKTTGWARFSDAGEAVSYGQVDLDELMEHLDEMAFEREEIKAVIVEDWLLFKKKAVQQVGSRMEASQAIGILKKFAKDNNAEFILQPSNVKSIAQKWTQLKPVGSHANSHWVDAFNHGAYYLINAGIRQTELERQHDSKTSGHSGDS